MPELPSTISRNWPMTSGTDWMRLTSSWALKSSLLRLLCSSLMYSLLLSTHSFRSRFLLIHQGSPVECPQQALMA